jgi:hypothetical protein
MSIKIVGIGKTGATSVAPRVNINPKNFRITFNKKAAALLDEHSKGKVEHVQILVDTDRPEQFWVKPAKPTENGVRKLARKKMAGCSVMTLLTGNYTSLDRTKGPQTLPISWDEKMNAAVVRIKVTAVPKKGRHAKNNLPM